MADIGQQDQVDWIRWTLGGMGSVILLLLGAGVADVRGRLAKTDELSSTVKQISAILEQIEKRLERIETECRERPKECAHRAERLR